MGSHHLSKGATDPVSFRVENNGLSFSLLGPTRQDSVVPGGLSGELEYKS